MVIIKEEHEMLIEKPEAELMWNSLTKAEQSAVLFSLIRMKQTYVLTKPDLDFPYFFAINNKPIFNPGEVEDFVNITDPYIFAVNAIFYLSRCFKLGRK